MSIRINPLGQPIGAAVEIDVPLDPPAATPMVGQFVAIVPLDADRHADGLFQAFSADDDADWTYLPYGPFPDVDAFLRWLGACARSDDTMFFVAEDDIGPCGMASYLRIQPWSASVEVGHIHFARRLQRTAAATEVMWLMMHRVLRRRIPTVRVEVRRVERTVARRRGATRVPVRRGVPTGDRLQGSQPGHGVVLDRRRRVATDRDRVRSMARPGELPRRRLAAEPPVDATLTSVSVDRIGFGVTRRRGCSPAWCA